MSKRASNGGNLYSEQKVRELLAGASAPAAREQDTPSVEKLYHEI